MDKELEDYYINRNMMFASKGWQDLMKDIEMMKESTDKISGVLVEDLRFKQGELSLMNWLLSLQDVSDQSYQDLQNADL